MKQMREQRNVGFGASATVGEQDIFSLALCSMVQPSFAKMLGPFVSVCSCWGSGKCVYMDSSGPWTLAFVSMWGR